MQNDNNWTEFSITIKRILTFDSFKTPWYIRIFGFQIKYLCEVLDEPEPTKDGYSYSIKIVSKDLYWFKWKIRNLKYENN